MSRFSRWLVVLRINVDLAIFQPNLDLEAGDDQSLKIQVARPGIDPGPLALQAKSFTTRPPLLPTPFSQVFSYTIQLRQKGSGKSCVTF